MAKKLFIIITVLFSAVLTTKAQVKVTARIDSAEILAWCSEICSRGKRRNAGG